MTKSAIAVPGFVPWQVNTVKIDGSYINKNNIFIVTITISNTVNKLSKRIKNGVVEKKKKVSVALY